MQISMKLTFAVLLSLSLITIASAFYPDEVFASKDATRIQQLILSKQKDGKWGDSHQTGMAIRTLASLSADVPQADKLCSRLNEVLGKTVEIQTVNDAVHSMETLKCGTSLPDSAVKVVNAALASDVLQDIYYAVDVVFTLVSVNHGNLASFNLDSVASKVLDLADDEGLFRSSVTSEEASARNTGLAYTIIGLLHANFAGLDSAVKDQIRVASEKAETLLEDESKISDLSTTYSILTGLNVLSNALGEQLTVPESRIAVLCQSVVENKYVHNIEDSFSLVAGLKVCSSNRFSVPLVASVVLPSGTGSHVIRVTNVMDQFVAKVKVQVRKSESDEPVTLLPGSDNVSFQLDSSKWVPGVYNLGITVQPLGEEEYLHVKHQTLRVKVTTDIKLEKTEAFLIDSAKLPTSEPLDSMRCTYPNSLSTITAAAGKFLHLKLFLGSNSHAIVPSQVFLRLSRINGGKSAYFVASSLSANLYALRLEIGSAEVFEALRSLGEGKAEFSLEWIVGDSLLAHSLTWGFGKIELPQLQINKETSKDHKVQEELSPKPEISHVFRPAEERPWTAFALIFSAICVLPFIVLMAKLASANLSFNVPRKADELLYAGLFQGTILAILAIFVLYWIMLNIFQALACIFVCGVLAVVTGQAALRALHSRSIEKLKAA